MLERKINAFYTQTLVESGIPPNRYDLEDVLLMNHTLLAIETHDDTDEYIYICILYALIYGKNRKVNY